MYSSSFSPSIVENFLKEKISLRVLGMFLGGFFYSITSLLFMRDTLESDLVISATIGVLYAALCSIYFVRFIYKVSQSIQTPYVISGLANKAVGVIDRLDAFYDDLTWEEAIDFDTEDAKPLVSNKTGHVQLVNLEQIYAQLQGSKVQVMLTVREGDFLAKGEILGYMQGQVEEGFFSSEEDDQDQASPSSLQELVNKQITVAASRNESYDYRYAIQKLVEVAVRALSAGVTDPYTVVDCVHTISDVTRRVACWGGGYYVLASDTATLAIYRASFKEDIFQFFNPIIHYGVGDLAVAESLFEAYKNIAVKAVPENISYLSEMNDYTYEKATMALAHSVDLTYVQGKYQETKDYIDWMQTGHSQA